MGQQMAAAGRNVLGAEEERGERSCPEGASRGCQREARASRSNRRAESRPGLALASNKARAVEQAWGACGGGSCRLPSSRVNRQADGQIGSAERDMAKEHVEGVKDRGTGVGECVPLPQTHTCSCPFVPRKDGAAAQLGPG